MSSKGVQSMKSSGFSLSIGATVGENSLEASTSYEKASSTAFKSATTAWSSFSIGATPTSDPMVWAA